MNKLSNKKPRIAVFIAARMNSTRLPKKATAIIEDQTLIEHIIDRMKQCKEVDEVVLCTSIHPDNKILLEIARKKGIRSFAGNDQDVMLRFLDASKQFGIDVIVRVTGDNPFTCPTFIDNAINHHLKTKADYTYTTELPRGTKGEIINVSALKKAHDSAENPNFSEYMTWYFTDNPDVFKVENILVDKNIRRPNYRLTVDTPEDLKLIREIYKRLYRPGKIVPLKEAITFLDNNPEVLKINKDIKSKDVKHLVNVRLKK
jgi:spore coat polysaccharide biosynthesis protein SpsF (cytidylyltransferase family)